MHAPTPVLRHHEDREGLTTVHAGTKLTADQLTALGPGDAVVIESGAEAGRLRHASGTVARVTGTQVVVEVRSARGVGYIQTYNRRDGYRVGRGTRAALVTVGDAAVEPADAEQSRQAQRIDALWMAWRRTRDDDALRTLHEAIGERLGVG